MPDSKTTLYEGWGMLTAFGAWLLVCASPLLGMGVAPLVAASTLLLAAVWLLGVAWQARPATAGEKTWRGVICAAAVVSAVWATWAFNLDRVAKAESAAAAAEQAADFESRVAARHASANGWLVGDEVNTYGTAVYICTRADDAVALQEAAEDEEGDTLGLFHQFEERGRACKAAVRGTVTAVHRQAVQVRYSGGTGWVPVSSLPTP